MKLSRRRVWAILRKELRDYRRTRSLLVGMAVFPLIFIVQPLVVVLALTADASNPLRHEHVLLYMLGIPALLPGIVAGTAVAGEREQGTLEPTLTTPITRDEFLLAKALAAIVPSIAIAYVVYLLFLVLVELFSQPGIASALIRGPDLLAQLLFTPLLVGWSIWVGMAISTRARDSRAAGQFGALGGLPSVFVIVLIAFNAIPATLAVALGAAALLLVLNFLGWRVTSRLFDRERLMTGPS